MAVAAVPMGPPRLPLCCRCWFGGGEPGRARKGTAAPPHPTAGSGVQNANGERVVAAVAVSQYGRDGKSSCIRAKGSPKPPVRGWRWLALAGWRGGSGKGYSSRSSRSWQEEAQVVLVREGVEICRSGRGPGRAGPGREQGKELCANGCGFSAKLCIQNVGVRPRGAAGWAGLAEPPTGEAPRAPRPPSRQDADKRTSLPGAALGKGAPPRPVEELIWAGAAGQVFDKLSHSSSQRSSRGIQSERAGRAYACRG